VICGVCRGSGSLLSVNRGRARYWDCPCCGSDGVEILYGPNKIRSHARKVYFDPEGILEVPKRKVKEQQQLDTFNQLLKE
jgi:hypothetical protein